MQQEQFSQQKFNEALILTNKIKANLKPFLKQFSEKNIKWIYSSIAILHHNLTHSSVQPLTKMNSMFAVKCIVDITQYVSLAFIETYILPIIKIGAMTDTDVQSGSRGHQFFITNNKVDETVESYGFNYVKVCTELINVLAVIKPRKLYFDQPTNDLSQFEIANIQLKQALKHPSSTLSFFKQTPANLKKNYEASLNSMNEDSEEYERFVQQKFYEQLKTGLSVQPKNLDIIQLIEAGDMYFMDQIVSIASDALQKGKTCNLIRYTLQFLNRLVRSGCKAVSLFFHGNDSVKTLVRSAIQIPGDNRKLERGENFLPNKNGTPQQKKQLYIEFLRSLEYWVNTYLKNSIKSPQKQSNTSKYYKILKHDYKLEFPQNPNLPKQLKQTEEKLKKNVHRNELFLEQLKQQDEVKSERSNSVVKASKPKVQSNSFDKLPSISRIKQTPKGDPTQQSCVARLNNVKKAIDNLGKSQKQLPRNIKFIQSEINQIGQDIQNVQGISDEAIQNLMNQYVELEVRKQKLQPIYEQYKVNKIDFKTFCNKIANPRSSKLIEENEKSRLRMQQKQKQIQRQRQIERQKEAEKQKQAERQKQIEAERLKQQQKIRQFERQKQIEKRREQERLQEIEKQRLRQLQIQKKEQTLRQREIERRREQQSFKQRQSKKSIQNSRENYNQDEVQVSQSSPPQSKIRNSLTNQRAQEIPKFNQGERVTYNQQQKNNQQKDQRVQFSRMGSDISRMSEDLHDSPKNLRSGSYNQFPHSKENGEAVSYEPVTIANHPGQYLDPNYEYRKSPIERISVKNQQYMIQVDDEIIQNPGLKPLDQSYHNIEEVYEQIKASKNFKDVINSQKLFIKNNKKQAMFWLDAQSGSLIKPVSSSQRRSRVQSNINVPDLLNQRSKKYEMQMQLLQQQKNKQILNLQKKLYNIQREKSEVSEKLKLKQYEIRSLKQNSEGGVRSRFEPEFNIVDDQNYVMKKMMDNKSVSNGRKNYQGLKIHSRVLAPGEIINTKMYQQYFHCIKNEKDKKRHVKNKQLIYKVDNDIEIGFMGHLEDQTYRLTLYVTPDQDFELEENQLNLHQGQLYIQYDLDPNLQIKAKKQQKIHFNISIRKIPYKMPTLFMKYRLANRKSTTCLIQLPCAYHKFFKISPLQEDQIVQLETPALIMRGQEIPYSKKLIKNLDIIQQLLPRVEKLNEGRANEFGEVCYGGVCSLNKIVFPIKVCIKPNEFLYIQTVKYESQNPKRVYEAQQYYIATINHLLMKDVQWK